MAQYNVNKRNPRFRQFHRASDTIWHNVGLTANSRKINDIKQGVKHCSYGISLFVRHHTKGIFHHELSAIMICQNTILRPSVDPIATDVILTESWTHSRGRLRRKTTVSHLVCTIASYEIELAYKGCNVCNWFPPSDDLTLEQPIGVIIIFSALFRRILCIARVHSQ